MHDYELNKSPDATQVIHLSVLWELKLSLKITWFSDFLKYFSGGTYIFNVLKTNRWNRSCKKRASTANQRQNLCISNKKFYFSAYYEMRKKFFKSVADFFSGKFVYSFFSVVLGNICGCSGQHNISSSSWGLDTTEWNYFLPLITFKFIFITIFIILVKNWELLVFQETIILWYLLVFFLNFVKIDCIEEKEILTELFSIFSKLKIFRDNKRFGVFRWHFILLCIFCL